MGNIESRKTNLLTSLLNIKGKDSFPPDVDLSSIKPVIDVGAGGFNGIRDGSAGIVDVNNPSLCNPNTSDYISGYQQFHPAINEGVSSMQVCGPIFNGSFASGVVPPELNREYNIRYQSLSAWITVLSADMAAYAGFQVNLLIRARYGTGYDATIAFKRIIVPAAELAGNNYSDYIILNNVFVPANVYVWIEWYYPNVTLTNSLFIGRSDCGIRLPKDRELPL
jgi:hypothetical protein